MSTATPQGHGGNTENNFFVKMGETAPVQKVDFGAYFVGQEP